MPYGVIPYGTDPYGNPEAPVAGDVIEVELPGVYVDALVFDETTEALLLLNMDPEKGSTGAPVNTHIVFEVFDTTGSTVDASMLNVAVDGVAAIVNGVFEAAFDGASSTITGDATDTLHVVIDPLANFVSEAVVVVNVVAANNAATHTIDETYVFKIDDVTAPKLLAARALGHMTVRVEYDEPMLAVSATGAADALNPALYTFTTASEPAVPIEAVSVAKVTDAEYDITLDIDMTPNAVYTVTVVDVEDIFDNAIVAPDNDADFNGYACPAPEDRDFVLWDMVGPLQKQMDDGDGTYEKMIACFQEVVDLLLCLADGFAEIYDPDYGSEVFVDAMLADLGNPFKFSLTLVDKRRLIRVLLDIYRLKGTAQGIINAVRFFVGIEVEVEPLNDPEFYWMLGEEELGWDTYLGPSEQVLLYSFRINAPYALTETERERITEIAEYMRPAHEHLVEVAEPDDAGEPDHWEIGESLLGEETDLH